MISLRNTTVFSLILKTVQISALCGFLFLSQTVLGQGSPESLPESVEVSQAIGTVQVETVADDNKIELRIKHILDATGWFSDLRIKVDEGVVFISGNADTTAHLDWALQLARKTEGVVAVVNQMEVVEPQVWDFTPAKVEMRALALSAVRQAPIIGIALLLLLTTVLATKLTIVFSRRVLQSRLKSLLLRDVAARALAVPVFLLGLYLVLRVSGLTRLALTVMGSTGLIGLLIGFAFRDIAENFLASILISIQHPFSKSDLIEVAGYQGYVQSVTSRCTILMTHEGNYIQIPNATIYKENITNYTANPKTQYGFSVGIGYDDSVSKAQTIILQTLEKHPAVVPNPEPLVLLDSLGAATVNLQVLFWIDISVYSPRKVRSAAIRLVKKALEEAGISMPDEAREVIFPQGVAVHMQKDSAMPQSVEQHAREGSEAAHEAEGDLASEAAEIAEQARETKSPEGGEDLLEDHQYKEISGS